MMMIMMMMMMMMMMMIRTMHKIRALIGKPTMNRRSCVAAYRLKPQLVAPQRRTTTSKFFPPLIRGGAALFLVIVATSPSVGGSVAMAYQAIGRTLRKSCSYKGVTLCTGVILRLSPTSLYRAVAEIPDFSCVLTTLHWSGIFSRSRSANQPRSTTYGAQGQRDVEENF